MSDRRLLLRPSNDGTVNDFMRDVVGSKADAAAVGAVTSTESIMAYMKQLANANGYARTVEKAASVLANAADDMFTIAGGPIFIDLLVGVVTTVLVGNANGKLQITTTAPAATVDMNAGAVAINADAAGTVYYCVGATSVFTPVTAGITLLDPVTVEPTQFIAPIGTIKFHSSAACTGVVTWYMNYRPLSPNSVVTVAA